MLLDLNLSHSKYLFGVPAEAAPFWADVRGFVLLIDRPNNYQIIMLAIYDISSKAGCIYLGLYEYDGDF